MPSSLPTVLTCAQPTGELHLGNYLGAVHNWVSLVDSYECFFGVVDMHAITVTYSPEILRKNILSCLAQYIACGLDPTKCHIFLQSQAPGHTELAWILACLTPLGQLERMTQFKDKRAHQQYKAIGAGLLYYPILMAADILLYNADCVPVGEDQKQHLELTRDLAEKFNRTYGETFKVPKPLFPKTGARIMSLQHPANKMSKSDPNQRGALLLLDEPETLRKKVMSAVTDTGKDIHFCEQDKPGISNLLTIYSAISGETIEMAVDSFQGKGYGHFKKTLADLIIETIQPIRKKYYSLMKEKEYLLTVLEEGANAARKRTAPLLENVYKRVGF